MLLINSNQLINQSANYYYSVNADKLSFPVNEIRRTKYLDSPCVDSAAVCVKHCAGQTC